MQSRAMTIDEAIDAQRATGQTAAQFQTTSPGDFIRKANADARASLDASRARGPIDPETGIASIDLTHVHPEHTRSMSQALGAPIRRATARVGQIFPLASTHILALEKALKEEIALEFWTLGQEMHDEYNGLRDELRARDDARTDLGAYGSAGRVDNGGTSGDPVVISAGGTSGTGATVDSGGSATSSGTISAGDTAATSGTISGGTTSSGSTDGAGTASTSGTVDNGGTAGG